jgi:hypothetical protein
MLFLGFSLLVIVPVSILLILTPVIIITLRKQVLNRKNLTNQGKHNKQVLKATTMLISVIVSFVVMATPFGVFHVISFFKSKAIHEENTTLYQSGRGIAQTLDQLNYTVNFFMYVLTSCQFRDAVVALFRSEKPLLSRRRPNISNETIKTTLSSTKTVREVRRVSIEDQTTANTSEKEEENHTP